VFSHGEQTTRIDGSRADFTVLTLIKKFSGHVRNQVIRTD
jgi:hypothetical protein